MALLLRVILFSSVVTLILSFLQLTLSYRSERASLESRFSEIYQATSRSLGESLWAMDSKQLEEQLDGILRLPSIRAVGVREMPPSHDTFSVFRGERQSSTAVVKEFPLVCCGAHPQNIGILHIEATLADIYRDVAAQALVILLSNAAKTFLVAFFILFVVHHLATRHLLDIAESVARIGPHAELPPVRLRRSRIEGDELDRLVDALNAMRERLRQHAMEVGDVNARMAAILNNIPDLAWVKDTNGRFIAVNRAVAAAKGFAEPFEMIGKTDFDIHPPELAQTYVRDDVEVMASHGCKRIEERHVKADGNTSWIETIKTALNDGAGRVAGTVGIARDVTERKRAEEALRQSEEQWKAVFENNPTMFFMVDAAGIILSVNLLGAEQLGYTVDELIGFPMQNLFHEADKVVAQRNTAVCLEQLGRPISWELRKVRKNGAVLWVRETARTMLIRERPVILIVCENITEAMRAAEILREVQTELVHANRLATMGQLVASIAHEVNQPIAATVTNAQAALRWLSVQPPDVKEARQVLHRIVDDGNRAGDVIGRIRALIKKAPPRKETLDINEAIREVIELTGGEARKHGASVRTQLAGCLPFVEADRVELQQVLLNLIINAVEAMSGIGDGVREVLVCTSDADNGFVLVAVCDSGPGLSSDSVESIFAPFYTTKTTGLGMGLSISRSIIEAHGGQLWASANRSRGAVFQFTVPAHSDVPS